MKFLGFIHVLSFKLMDLINLIFLSSHKRFIFLEQMNILNRNYNKIDDNVDDVQNVVLGGYTVFSMSVIPRFRDSVIP